MRDYGAVSPRFWIGESGKALRGHMEAQVLALYLMTCPHSNALGIYHCPLLYMAHETGLGMEGATKGLARLLEVGFCTYDEASESVFVKRMAAYQIAETIKPNDKRAGWLQKEYEKLPVGPMKAEFFAIYSVAYGLKQEGTQASPSQAPPKPLPSQEQEQEQEQEQNSSGEDGKPSGGKPPADQSKTELWRSAVSLLSGQGMDEPQARSFIGKLTKDYKTAGEDIVLQAVRSAVTEQPPDARAYLKATCQRMAGERRKDGVSDWTREAL